MTRPVLERLEMFFTNRCNLACRYCSSRRLLDRGAPRSLSPGRMEKAVSLFSACPGPGSGRRTIAFTGGEPFLEFDALVETIERIRAGREDYEVCVSTNGTLLTAARLERLRGLDVNVSLSLDGGKAVNDSHRRFFDAPGRSVFDAVVKNLGGLPRPLLDHLHVTVTVAGDAARRIVESTRALLGLGLRHIEVCFDLYTRWDPARLAQARGALRAFRDFCMEDMDCAALSAGGGTLFKASFMDDLGPNASSPLRALCLSPEGLFYPCDTLCAAGAAGYSVGDLDKGIDFAALARVHAELARFMASQGRPETAPPPIDRYFHAKLNGLDPAVMLQGVGELDAAFNEELGPLAAMEQAVRAHKRSGLFDRTDALQDVDRRLRSKGRDKELLLVPADPEAAEGIALYALLKAKKLKKRLRLRIQADASSLPSFLKEYAVSLPGSLELFLTSRCNCCCDYCSSRGLRRKGEETLPLSSVLRAAELCARGLSPTASPSLSFTGGEPLLEYGLLAEAVDRIHREYPRLELRVTTNGTLLDPGKARFLLERGARITVSLDGHKAVTDRHRRFREDAAASVFDAVARRLSRLPAPLLREMDAAVTLTSATMGELASALACLQGLGFKNIWINFDIMEVWTGEKLRRLRQALVPLRRACLSGALDLRGLDFERMDRCAPAEQLTRELIVSPDGKFYSCNAACDRGLAGHRVGDLGRGVDFDKLRRICDSALAALPEGHADSLYPFLDRYYYAEAMGRDPASMVEGGCRAGRILSDALGPLLHEAQTLRRLERDPHFGDFGHEPRYRSKDELASIRLPMGSGLPDELARLRQAADFCLYSPGRGKTLLMVPKDPKASFQLVEGIALYSRLKAESLKKRLSLRLLADASSLSAEQLRFLDDHGVLHSRALLSLERGDALWSDSELDALRVAAGLPIDLAGSCDPRAAAVAPASGKLAI